jgi:hypothetical protein
LYVLREEGTPVYVGQSNTDPQLFYNRIHDHMATKTFDEPASARRPDREQAILVKGLTREEAAVLETYLIRKYHNAEMGHLPYNDPEHGVPRSYRPGDGSEAMKWAEEWEKRWRLGG